MADSSGDQSPTMDTNEPSLCMLPTELIFIIFEFVPPKDMIRCRQVCSKWRDIIDVILKDDNMWKRFCKRDYGKVYQKAMWKSFNIETWFELYRSLSLWPNVGSARESIDEFCHSDTIDDEMRSVVVQEKGTIMVLKRTRLVYHNLWNLKVSRRKGSVGQYISMVELKDVVVMLGLNGQLHVVKKPYHDWTSNLIINTYEDDEISFDSVKSFIIGDRTIFFSTYQYTLYSFHIDNDKVAREIILPESTPQGIPDGLAGLGYSNGCLNILTLSENMYKYEDNKVTLKFKLTAVMNLMDMLYKHNMLECIDWRHYYILLLHLKLQSHTGILQFISRMNVYGDLFFVGTQSGILNIFYKPIYQGQLDLGRFPPIKVYNFTARIDIPILSVHPIMNIDVTETKDGHIMLVCMPRKILAITFSHDLDKPISRAVVPYVASPELSV